MMRFVNWRCYRIQILAIFLLVTSCTSIKNNKKSCIAVDIVPDQEVIIKPLSEIVKRIEIVRFESKENAFLGSFSRLVHVDNNHSFFVSEKKVLLFDNRTGVLINRIDAYGKGPHEYQTIINTFVDNKSELIYIVDYKNIKVYDYNGLYKNTIRIAYPSGGLYRRKKDGKLFVNCIQIYNKQNRDLLHVLDSTANLVHTFKSRNPDVCDNIQQNLRYAGRPYEVDNRLYYIEPFIDTIYEIIDTILQPIWYINQGKYRFETKDGINIENYESAWYQGKLTPIGFKMTKDLFFINYDYNNNRYISLYDKRKSEFLSHTKYKIDLSQEEAPKIGLKNDMIDDAPPFWPDFVDDSLIVQIIQPSSLSNLQLKNLKCKLGDNAILFIATLK